MYWLKQTQQFLQQHIKDQVSKANSTTTSSMSSMNMSTPGTTNKTTVTRDSTTVLLEGKTIPGKGFIHLYDSTPYMINAGHIALHVPCDASSKPIVDVLIGPAPNFTKVQPDIIQALSQPGKMCLYHVDINSEPAKESIPNRCSNTESI